MTSTRTLNVAQYLLIFLANELLTQGSQQYGYGKRDKQFGRVYRGFCMGLGLKSHEVALRKYHQWFIQFSHCIIAVFFKQGIMTKRPATSMRSFDFGLCNKNFRYHRGAYRLMKSDPPRGIQQATGCKKQPLLCDYGVLLDECRRSVSFNWFYWPARRPSRTRPSKCW